MSQNPISKLAEELHTGSWADIRSHLEREAVFVVANNLDLLEVGAAVMTDDVKSVGKWLESGSLARPTKAQVGAWDAIELKSFRFLILAPYVLIQEAGH